LAVLVLVSKDWFQVFFETSRDLAATAGPPCGFVAQVLVDVISQKPGLSPSFIAEWLAQRPIDHEELQMLCWSAQMAIRVEQNTSQALTTTSSSNLGECTGDLWDFSGMYRWWMRTY